MVRYVLTFTLTLILDVAFVYHTELGRKGM